MRQLLPEPHDDVDPIEAYETDLRPAPADRPWVMLNMITSADGATAVEGVSGGLGGAPDRLVFKAIRSLADFILVGSGTVRAENYGPPRTDHRLQERRVLRGQAPHPRIAVVSSRLDLDLGSPLFADSDPPALVITSPGADRARRTEVADRADLMLAGQGARVDLGDALRSLREMGARVVLVEGGPSLNAQLLGADLVDELCLTIAPLLVGGTSSRIVAGAQTRPPVGLDLARVLTAEGLLFLRYVRSS